MGIAYEIIIAQKGVDGYTIFLLFGRESVLFFYFLSKHRSMGAAKAAPMDIIEASD